MFNRLFTTSYKNTRNVSLPAGKEPSFCLVGVELGLGLQSGWVKVRHDTNLGTLYGVCS